MTAIDEQVGTDPVVRSAVSVRRRRRPARRHDEALIRAEMRRLARALAPYRVPQRDPLRLAGDGPR